MKVDATEVSQATQDLNASNVESTVILLRIATHESNIIIVGRSNIS